MLLAARIDGGGVGSARPAAALGAGVLVEDKRQAAVRKATPTDQAVVPLVLHGDGGGVGGARPAALLGGGVPVEDEVGGGEEGHDHEAVEEDVVREQHLQPAQALHLHRKDLLDARLVGVSVEGSGAELDDGDGAEVDERDVEEEGGHERGADLHWVHRHEHEVQPQLHVALDHAAQQVEAEERERRRPEQAEDRVELDEEVVEEGAGGRVDEHVQDNVEHPAEGDRDAQHAHRPLDIVEHNGEDPGVLRVLPLGVHLGQVLLLLLQQHQLLVELFDALLPRALLPVRGLRAVQLLRAALKILRLEVNLSGTPDVLRLGDDGAREVGAVQHEIDGHGHHAHAREEDEEDPADARGQGHHVHREGRAYAPRLLAGGGLGCVTQVAGGVRAVRRNALRHAREVRGEWYHAGR
mmetsp:Transcript_33140/g.72257  ORF Transcript_33140/g.72257 Transcript_33140/m.72257 type:complete len:410 (+) Transcript_33140:428-1657(+)